MQHASGSKSARALSPFSSSSACFFVFSDQKTLVQHSSLLAPLSDFFSSPLDLLQEYYAHDSWQLLACCALMSRVSSAAVKTRVLAAFFELCPTPSALLDTSAEALQALMHPLGLFPNRMQSLVALSTRYLSAPIFEVGLTSETKVYGFGEFGVASFQIFCRGNLGAAPEDATLKAFVAWQKRHPRAGKKGAAADGQESAPPRWASAPVVKNCWH
jgi:methyl-CpG-binding domain protein 4